MSTKRVIYGGLCMKNNEYYGVAQIKPNLWAIEDIKSTEQSISYLICGRDKALLFDTGLGLSPVSPLVRSLTGVPIVVVLSHWHFDHVGGAHEFDYVIGWKSDAMIQTSENGIARATIKKQVDLAFWESIDQSKLQTHSFSNIKFIEKEQTIDVGDYSFSLLHTPGHTQDSICLYEPNQGWLFSGDSAYPGPIYLQFQDSDAQAYQSSIHRLLKFPIKTIMPGHNETQASASLLTEIKKILENPSYTSLEFPNLSVVH